MPKANVKLKKTLIANFNFVVCFVGNSEMQSCTKMHVLWKNMFNYKNP